MPRTVSNTNVQMPAAVPQPPQNNNFAANIGFVPNQPQLTTVGAGQVNAIAQRVQNTVTQTNGPVATQVQTQPIQNSEGLPGTVTTVTQSQPIQIVSVTSNVTINLATSLPQGANLGNGLNSQGLLQQRYNNIRNQLISQGVPAGNINMGTTTFNLQGAANQTNFNVQTNTTTQNGTQTTTTTTTKDYTYGE